MPIIKTTEEAREFFPAAISVDISRLLPKFPDAIDKYILPYLGFDQFELLETWYDNEKPDEVEGTPLKNLLPYVQRALIRFSIFMSADELDVQFTNSGFAVTSTQNLTPASPERVAKFKASIENGGWDAIEMMLRYLENNKDDYSTWSASDSYTLAIKNLVNSASEFYKSLGLEESRLTFHRMRPVIDQIDYLKIIPAISQDLFDEIMAEMEDDNVSTENELILPSLKKAEIFFTAAEEINKKYERMAMHYLTDVKKILDASPDDYPAYRDSGLYTAGETNYPSFLNEEDNTIFVMGSKE